MTVETLRGIGEAETWDEVKQYRNALINRARVLHNSNPEKRRIIQEVQDIQDYANAVRGAQDESYLGQFDTIGRARGKGKGGLFKAVKKVALAPGRNAFLGLLDLNVRASAKALDAAERKKPGHLKKLWERLGGNYSKLRAAINKGKGKKALLGGGKNIHGIGVISVVALLAAAAPILVTMAASLKTVLPNDPEVSLNEAVTDAKSAGGNTTVLDETTQVTDPEGSGAFGIPMWALLAGGGLVAAKVLKFI